MLIGAETRRALPEGSVVEPVPCLRVKGKQEGVEAYLLRTLPDSGSALEPESSSSWQSSSADGGRASRL